MESAVLRTAKSKELLLVFVGLLGGYSSQALCQVVTNYSHDLGDNVNSVTDPRGLVTSYAFDGLGQKWQQVSPDTGTTSFSYDGYGRLGSMTRADGTQTTYGYDAINRRNSVNAAGLTQTLTYDSCTNGIGRLCSSSDATGTTSYTYTPEGWVSGRGFSIGGTAYALGYGYNALGQVTTVVYPDGNQALYAYTDGVVSAVQLNVGGTVSNVASSITYRPSGSTMIRWTSSNGLVNTLGYDTDGRLTGIAVPGVQGLGLSYDVANRVNGITNSVDTAMTQDFGYDAMSRLTSVYSGADNEGFQYDASSNRTSQVLNGSSETLTPSATNNSLVSLAGASNTSYGYDARGNLTTVGGVPTFTYDAFNRMSTAGGATYYVNPEGQRLRKTVGGASTYFAPDPAGPLWAESQGTGWSDYVWLNGRLIGRVNGGQVLAIHDDQVGRPEAMTDGAQSVAWRARNFVFDRTVTVANAVPLNLGFPGQYFDAESGLWNNGFRDYSASLGRYVESDPLGLQGGVNTYAYVGGNPLSRFDWYGLAWQYSFGVNLTVITPEVGVSINIGAGISFDGWNSRGYDQAQVNVSDVGKSHGYFFGVGPAAGAANGSTPTTGATQSPYLEADVGAAIGAGGSAAKDGCDITYGLSKGYAGPGVGIGGFAGTSYTATFVGPTLGTIFGH